MSRGVRVSLAACEPCRRTYDPTPGGVTCPCGRRCVQAVVILPRGESGLAMLTAASDLLLRTLTGMRELAPGGPTS